MSAADHMMTHYSIFCELKLAAIGDGGLLAPMPAPTPSLLLVFANLDSDEAEAEVQIGARISGPPALVPGMSRFPEGLSAGHIPSNGTIDRRCSSGGC